MKLLSIKEISDRLKMTLVWESWMDQLETDNRIGVQKLLISWKNKQVRAQQELAAHKEKCLFDASYCSEPYDMVAGVDEAGRGPLAGPVVTAAVILSKDTEELIGLNDSKQITKKKRDELAAKIKKNAISYSIHFQSVEKIDELNIYEATKQSMSEAVYSLRQQPAVVLVDAMNLPIEIETHSIIKGDAQSLSIAAASILAKTARDDYMEKLHEEYPQYLFNQHAGYGTKQHVEMIYKYGPSVHHRKTFEPIKSLIKK